MSFMLPLSVYEDASYNDLRRGYLLLIASLIEEYLMEGDANDHLDMIIAVEKSCYDHAIDTADYELLSPNFSVSGFEQLYRTLVVRITKNLDINSEVGDEHLATGLLDGSIDPETTSRLDDRELSLLNNSTYINELNVRMNQVVKLKTSTLYRCSKCGKRETTIKSVQTRSLDEGETIMCVCSFCGYRFTV